MAVEIGTATDSIDLYSKLLTFLSTDSTLVADSEQWQILRDAAFPFTGVWPGRLAFHTQNTTYATVAPDLPPPEVPSTYVKWKVTGNIVAPSAGVYSFSLRADDQAFVRINGSVVGGTYSSNMANSFVQSFDVTLTAGNNPIELILVYLTDMTHGVSLGWKKPGDSVFSIVPSGNYSGMSCAWGYTKTANQSLADMLAIEKDRECVVKGPGLAGTDEIYLTMRTVSSAQADSYNLELRYATGFLSTAYDFQQPGASLQVFMTLWDQSIPYWFVASGRRFIAIGKVSTVYANMYGGFYLPYGLPSEVPYPVAIGANANTYARWSDQTAINGGFWNPSAPSGQVDSCNLAIRSPGGVRVEFANFTNASGASAPTIGRTYPYANGEATVANGGSTLIDYRTSPDGSYALQPIVLHDSANIYGELDGVFHVSGFGNSSESSMAIGPDTYRVFQGGFRTTAHDYAAIRMD